MGETLVYLREAKGLPAVADQQEAIRAAGVPGVDPNRDRAYLDREPKRRRQGEDTGLPERDACIRAIRRGAGDRVYVAEPGVLAVSLDDALTVLRQITERGAVLHIVSSGQDYRWHEDAAQAIALAIHMAEEAQQRRTKLARASALERRRRLEAKAVDIWKEAKRLWKDDAVTVTVVSERTGLAPRTLYRRLGPKGTASFTGGPRPAGKGKRK